MKAIPHNVRHPIESSPRHSATRRQREHRKVFSTKYFIPSFSTNINGSKSSDAQIAISLFSSYCAEHAWKFSRLFLKTSLVCTTRFDPDPTISIHFNSPLHRISKHKITPIEQIDSKFPAELLRREQFWMNTLHTKYPNPSGLNSFCKCACAGPDYFCDITHITVAIE